MKPSQSIRRASVFFKSIKEFGIFTVERDSFLLKLGIVLCVSRVMPAAIVLINLSFFNDVKNAVVLCSWQVVGSEYFMKLRFALATPQQTEHSGDT